MYYCSCVTDVFLFMCYILQMFLLKLQVKCTQIFLLKIVCNNFTQGIISNYSWLQLTNLLEGLVCTSTTLMVVYICVLHLI